ncbi:MAG: DNA-processing protein DprA [Venatoribacter sp.]
MKLKDEQLLAWWRFSKLPGVGNVSLNTLRSKLEQPTDLASLSTSELVDLGLSSSLVQQYVTDHSLSQGFELLKNWCQRPNAGVLLFGVAPYPEELASLPDAPMILYYQGDLNCLAKAKIAMVGSRNATPYAVDWVKRTAAELASQGVVVVSGLALGIDGAAHYGALETGSTIAVLGCGIDVIYPARHKHLAQSIVQQGLLLSEFLPGTKPEPRNFPSRNRIVSGLSTGVVVVEAALKSGSLITAKLAADQGREVMALPGAVTNPLSHGCHQLIRDGAALVQNATEILEAVNLFTGAQASLFAEQSQPPAPALLRFIDYTTTAVDSIAIRSGKSMSELLPELLELELAGWLQQVPNGYQRIK